MVLAVAWVLLALAAAATFVFETAVTPFVEDPALVLATAVFTAVLLFLMGGLPGRGVLASLGRARAIALLGAGALGGTLAPALVALSRYSDSPPGTVVAFWTTSVWGALLVLGAALRQRRFGPLSAALLAVVGTAGILGNWERPSSLSLFVAHTSQEVAFVVAGLAWALSVLVAVYVARDHRPALVYTLSGVGTLVSALAWALPAAGWDSASLIDASVLPAAASRALLLALSLYVAIHAGPRRAGAAWMLAVPLITSLLFVEEATGVFGPRPILVDAAGWASVLIVIAVVLLVVPGGSGRHSARSADRPARAPLPHLSLVLASLAAASALVAFASPGVEVAVRATLDGGGDFAADFRMLGVQTVGGWLAFSVACVAIAAAVGSPTRTQALAGLLGALTALGGHASLAFTPLHVWMRWIPPQVQQDYGSEYATIVFTPVPAPAQLAALALAACALAWISARRMLAHTAGTDASAGTAGGQDR